MDINNSVEAVSQGSGSVYHSDSSYMNMAISCEIGPNYEVLLTHSPMGDVAII